MSETLYRKHRPQTFQEIIGQEHIKITLESEIINDKIAHAYLFAGPRGIGKTTMARVLAKSINCKKKEKNSFEPCNKCQSCLSINKGNNLDLIEIDAASNRGINEIRELREMIKYPPNNGFYKVFIIDEVHMLTIEAFNALLKTLEEPPQHAIFILATTELYKLPLTIVSRCEKFDFKVVDIEKLKVHLKNIADKEKVKVSSKIIEKIARYSQGYVRDALSTLGQILSLAENDQVDDDVADLVMPKSDYNLILDLIDNLISESFDLAISGLATLVSEGINLKYFTEELINYLRKIILVKISKSSKNYFFDIEKEIEEKIISQSKNLDLKIWQGILEEFYNAFNYLNNDGFQQLPLEMAIISIKNKYFSEINKKKHDDYHEKLNGEDGIIKDNSKQNIILSKKNEKTFSNDENFKKNIKLRNKEKHQFNKIDNEINISIKEVIKIWPKLLINLKDYNYSLSAFVKVGHPLELKNNRLNLGFKFKFHLDRVLQDESKRVVEDILKDLLGFQLLISGRIDDNYEKNHEKMVSSVQEKDDKNKGLIDNLIQNFGGEVVS